MDGGAIAKTAEAAYLDQCSQKLMGLREPSASKLTAIEGEASARWQPRTVRGWNRELARSLLTRNASEISKLDVPAEIRRGFQEEFARIREEIERKPLEHFGLDSSRLRADLRVLALRRIPAGTYDLEVSGVPRRLLGRQGLAGGFRLAAVIMAAGGFAPFFTQHLVPHRVKLFSPDEHERYLRRVGMLLSRRPEIRGLLSTAWYNDPAIAGVSPQMSYLRERFERWGRGVFVIGSSPQIVRDATAFSFERRQLVDAGKYRPMAYLGIMLREQLLALASATPTGEKG